MLPAMAEVPLLIISGPVGVGKTTVAAEVSFQLERVAVAHTLIDLDALAATYPRSPDDPFGSNLARDNLRGMWPNCAAAGSRNVIIARVIEVSAEVDAIAQCIPGAVPTVCRLTAGDATLLHRVRQREVGSECAWHEARALQLAQFLRQTGPTDFTVDTERRPVQEIAAEIVAALSWAPPIGEAAKMTQTKQDVFAKVTELCAPLGAVTGKAMFGGIGVFCDDAMFALITRHGELYFKTDDVNRPKHEQAGLARFGKMPYHQSPPLTDWQALAPWATDAHRAAQQAAKKRRKPR